MLVKLLKQHFIGGTLHEPDEELDVAVVSPHMEGLDEAARAAIRQENVRVYGRFYRDAVGNIQMVDDPPIPRPLEENKPVGPAPSQGGPS